MLDVTKCWQLERTLKERISTLEANKEGKATD